jgi:hypothetical protein
MSTSFAAGVSPSRRRGFSDPRPILVVAIFADVFRFCRLIGGYCRSLVATLLTCALLGYLPSIVCLRFSSVRRIIWMSSIRKAIQEHPDKDCGKARSTSGQCAGSK